MIPEIAPGWIIFFLIIIFVQDYFLIQIMQYYRNNQSQNSEPQKFIAWLISAFNWITAFINKQKTRIRSHSNIKFNFHKFKNALPFFPKNFPKLDYHDYDDVNGNRREQAYKSENKAIYKYYSWLLGTGFIICGIIGQLNFTNLLYGQKKGIIYYAIACIFLIMLILHKQTIRKQQQHTEVKEVNNNLSIHSSNKLNASIAYFTWKRGILLLAAIVFTFLTLLITIKRPFEDQHWDIFIFWVLSWSFFLMAFIQKFRFNVKNFLQDHRIDIIVILSLSIVGGILRFYKLGMLPVIVDGDEGAFGLIILDILFGRLKDMFITVRGSSTMYFFFIAGLMKIFGTSVTTLRIGSAIGGTLTIPFFYLLSKSLTNRKVAIISTIILTVSAFHIHFSRIMSVTGIQDGFFATASLYFFYTGLIKKSTIRTVLSGFLLGIAIYVYMGARLIILLIPIYLLILFFIQPKIVKENKYRLILFLLILIIVLTPMIYWSISRPSEFYARVYQVGVFQSGWIDRESQKLNQPQWIIFLQLFKQAFLTTIYYPSTAFHFSRLPMIDPFCSVTFIAGLIYSLVFTKDKRYLLLNGWFWSGILVGGAMVIVPSYCSYRILIIFPVVCLFCGIGLERLTYYIFNNFKFFKTIQMIIISTFLIIISIFNIRYYFFQYEKDLCNYDDVNTHLAYYIGSYNGKLDKAVMPYLLTYPVLEVGSHPSLEFLSQGNSFQQYKEPLSIVPPDNLDQSKKYAFYFIPARENELYWIENILPGGHKDTVYECNEAILQIYTWSPDDISPIE